jgi:molybdopterin/thiamine biosynthesis adenylyltransferase
MTNYTKTIDYKRLVSRNLGLVTQDMQKRLSQVAIGIAGCGMGSFVAETLCRLGVKKFIIADYDTVEVANFNHQAFNYHNLGQQKSVAVANILKSINKKVKIKIWRKFVTAENVANFVEKSDIVIDSIDPTSLDASLSLARECRKRRKIFLYPMDMGWGATLLRFYPRKGEKFEEILKIPVNLTLEKFRQIPLWELLEAMIKNVNPPPYFYSIIKGMKKGKLRHYPQPISAALSASVLVVMAVLRILQKKDFPLLTEFRPIK